MNIEDTHLKSRALRAIDLQTQGMFIVDQRQELPLLGHRSLANLRYSHERDEQGRYYDYETDWGKFSFDTSERSLLVLRKGEPPDGLHPQPLLSLANATLHAGYVKVHNNGSSFELDFPSQEQLNWESLRLLNETLRSEDIPLVVWQLEEGEGEKVLVIRISNDSAMVFASSAIWDNENQQLVATQVVTTSQELLKAIKATLANNNSKSYLTIKSSEGNAFLRGAKKGYVAVNNSLTAANAEGVVTVLLHPLSGDPQAFNAEHFYVVVAPGEELSQKFAERLDLAIPWPIQPQWADYLLNAGQEAELVSALPGSGKDFAVGLRVSKNETLWQQLIACGIKDSHIQI